MVGKADVGLSKLQPASCVVTYKLWDGYCYTFSHFEGRVKCRMRDIYFNSEERLMFIISLSIQKLSMTSLIEEVMGMRKHIFSTDNLPLLPFSLFLTRELQKKK